MQLYIYIKKKVTQYQPAFLDLKKLHVMFAVNPIQETISYNQLRKKR